MHILVIPSIYPTKYQSKATFIKEQVNTLADHIEKIGLIYPSFIEPANLDNSILKKIEIQKSSQNFNIYYYYSKAWIPRRPHGTLGQWLRAGRKLFKEYITNEGLPDVIHVHFSLNAGALALEIFNRYKIPFIITEHWSAHGQGTLKKWQIKKINEIFSHVYKIIAISLYQQKILSKNFEKFENRITYIPNMINTDFYNVKKIHFKKGDTFRFICISALIKNKGVSYLIHAINKIREMNIHLDIIGDGQDFDILSTLIKDLKLQNKINLLGYLPQDQVKQQIQKSHALVHPSLFETFGIVIIEALSCGKPVIVTRCGGPEYIVDDQNGILVEKADVDDLARGMMHVMENYNNYNGILLHEDIESQFSDLKVTKKIINLYQQIINQ